jgi:hypothetical protein
VKILLDEKKVEHTAQIIMCFASRKAVYSSVQQKCFMYISCFFTTNTKKACTQGQDFIELIIFTALLRTFLSETGSPTLTVKSF